MSERPTVAVPEVFVGNSSIHDLFRPLRSMLTGRVAFQIGFIVSAMLFVTALAHADTITLNFDATPLGPE